MLEPKRNKNREFIFSEYPDFKPNLSPREILLKGSFGGTYMETNLLKCPNKKYKDKHLVYPNSWWKDIPKDHMTREWKDYDKNINTYKVKVGTTLEFWEYKQWITKYHPYGWFQWYCHFFSKKDLQTMKGKWEDG